MAPGNNMNNTKKPRILVAEDNRVMGNVIRFNLERSGFEVTLVHDGQSAMRMAEGNHFDLVVTDYQMPHASGEEVCHYIRHILADLNTPVILVSAKGIELQSSEVVAPERFTRVVYKPFSPREIVRIAQEELMASMTEGCRHTKTQSS